MPTPGSEAPGPIERLALDTSAYSRLRQGHPEVVDRVALATIVEVSATVLGELEAGFRKGSRHPENSRSLAEFLAEPFVRVRETSRETARRYGILFDALRKAGTPIPINDVWIAAAALEANAPLLTFDTDFSRIADLPLILLA